MSKFDYLEIARKQKEEFFQKCVDPNELPHNGDAIWEMARVLGHTEVLGRGLTQRFLVGCLYSHYKLRRQPLRRLNLDPDQDGDIDFQRYAYLFKMYNLPYPLP